jgi:hypothetical protein
MGSPFSVPSSLRRNSSSTSSHFRGHPLQGTKRVSSGGAGGSIIFHRIADRNGRGTRVREIGFIGLPEYAGAEQALRKLVESGVA